ncbi:MAG: hypothetical protein HY898_01905 [Deltaproteobacteria bacterium]|nr:hypothetical protein [Deltaproteobacteria bacterium]
MTRRFIVLACMCAVLGGCEAPMARGVEAYNAGCYPEAASQLVASEADLPDMSARQRTRYALYRGLAHLALDDVRAAHPWIQYSKAMWDSNRWLLDPKDAGRLLSAWQALGHERGEWGMR